MDWWRLKDAKPLYLEEDFICERERAASHFIRIHQNSSTGGDRCNSLLLHLTDEKGKHIL